MGTLQNNSSWLQADLYGQFDIKSNLRLSYYSQVSRCNSPDYTSAQNIPRVVLGWAVLYV